MENQFPKFWSQRFRVQIWLIANIFPSGPRTKDRVRSLHSLLGLKFFILDLDRANSHSFSNFKTGTCFGTCDKTQSDTLVDGFVYTIL